MRRKQTRTVEKLLDGIECKKFIIFFDLFHDNILSLIVRFHTQLPAGVNKIFIEIFDECNFTMDELIAWSEVRIPDVVLERGETHEDW